MSVLWEIDPTSEDAANVSLVLVDSTFRLVEMDLTPPDIDAIYASSADTEGNPFVGSRHTNRIISLSFIAVASTNALLQTAVYGVQQKIDKLRREGGTLQMTTQAGTTVVGDVLFARFKPEFTPEMYVLNRAVRFGLEFECKPYFRGAPIQQADHTETSLPCLVFTETSLAGDVWGLGKLIIDEDQGADQWWLTWGLQSRYYDPATSAALFYEAEGRTPLGGAAIAAGPSGASGAGSNVMRTTALTTSYLAFLSTQAVSAGAHLSHVGSFRVYARVQTPSANGGVVSIALEWAEGDFRTFTRNTAVSFPENSVDGTWRLLDLGQVYLTKVPQGTQRWEGRVLAKSTVPGDGLDIDYLMLVPTGEGSGIVSAVRSVPAPTAFTARDEFDQASGGLATLTLPLGGSWSGFGDTTDWDIAFTADSETVVSRSAISDTSALTQKGRFGQAGTTSLAAIVLQEDFKTSTLPASGFIMGQFARLVDSSNYVAIGVLPATGHVSVSTLIAGTGNQVGNSADLGAMDVDIWYTLRTAIDTQGRIAVWFVRRGTGFGTPHVIGQSALLATGGTLATGKFGMYDQNTSATAATRDYDNFFAAPLVGDAAVFASQSLEVRSDYAIREDSAGTIWTTPSRYEGDYLKIPPEGKEGRTVRIIVKGSRNDLTSMPDNGIDDVSARLTYTPRYLVLPA